MRKIGPGKERTKEAKQERKLRKGTLMETATAMEIEQGGLRHHSLDDFHRCLENPAGFSTVTTSPTTIN
jgi:hypothetical protein